ncbi:hypothetical protein SAMN05518672_1011150 [Chitinophaga sp. CF118]|nr:hypothetical protein SAMN05518672_1011150 [Chitinophaga sp. CF118]
MAGFLFPSFGQDAGVFKANHIKSSVSWLFNHLNDKKQLVDSCVYNEKGLLVFRRTYDLFKEDDYEDKRYTYNAAGLQTMCVNYGADGLPWLTDSVSYDTQNRLVFEKVYRNTNGQVFMNKIISYKKDKIEIEDTKPGGTRNVCIRTSDKDGRITTETIYRDTSIIERTEYSYPPGLKEKKIFNGRVLYKVTRISDDGLFQEDLTYQNGLVAKVQVKKSNSEEEKLIFGNVSGWVPVKRELTIWSSNGLKEMVKYYQGTADKEQYYQHIEYKYTH